MIWRHLFFALVMIGVLLALPQAWAEDWQVVWKDSMREVRMDRDSVRAEGTMVEYWYSDEEDAIVDWMESRYYVVSDCEGNRMRHVTVYDPATGENKPVANSEWADMTYDPEDPIKLMHYEVCHGGVTG